MSLINKSDLRIIQNESRSHMINHKNNTGVQQLNKLLTQAVVKVKHSIKLCSYIKVIIYCPLSIDNGKSPKIKTLMNRSKY